MIVYLYPKAPFAHSVPRSDTLFGALAWSIRLLYGRQTLEALLEGIESAVADDAEPPMLLSSLFPFFEDEQGRILFYPRPMLPPASLEIQDERRYASIKKLKRASYLSDLLFKQVIAGQLSEQALFDGLQKEDFFNYQGALMTREEKERMQVLGTLQVRGEAARNTISRLSSSTDSEVGGQLFYQKIVTARSLGRVRGGFFMLLRAQDVNMARAAIRYLADKGIGGDTTVGRGHCEVEFGEDSLKQAENNERLITLSLFYPGQKDREMLKESMGRVYGQIERRKGFLEASFLQGGVRVWKPTLLTFKEGSTFPDVGRRVYGSLYGEERARAGMDYRVRVNGLAYMVKMKEAF